MSKERELLEKIAVQLPVFDLEKASALVDEIQKLLAQPEYLREDLREDIREGISLRDHFAGLAMQGLLAADKRRQLDEKGVCLIAYSQADKMLMERSKRGD